MTLKSRSELLQEQSKTMDLMDVNQVLEVPDTPDRQVSATHDSDFNERRNNASTNNQNPSKDYINGRMRNQQIENGKSVTVSGNRKLFIHPYSSTSFEHPRPSVDTTRHDKGKGKSLCNSDVQKLTHQEGEQNGHGHSGISRVNTSRKGVLPLNRIPAVESFDRSSKSCKVDNTFKNVAHHKAESSIQPCTSIKNPHKRMLVRNGCISPHNIAKSKQVEKKHETGIVVKLKEVQNGSTSSTVDIKDMVTEDKDSHRCKGKGVSVSHHHLKEPDVGSSHLPHRKTIHKEQSTQSERWRTTHNHRKQRDIEQQKKGMMQMDHRNEKDSVNLDESKIVSASSSVSTSRNLGKPSVSFVDDFNGETSTSRPKSNKNLNGVGPSNPVVEPVTRNNEDSSVRALQVEADEMLARELQQQLYNEELTPVLEVNEMDSHLPIAMPAQQDNSTRQAGGRRAYRRQASSSLNARQPNTSRPSSVQRSLQPQAHASRRMSQLRTRFQTINRRNSIFPPNMDVDVRMQILEMLEADGDRRRRNDVSRIRREFNEDDYEMLLALDDDNHRHGGATHAQINNLPESTVQAENLQECSICLETPTIGETIRHLPCLHRFHKECIDQWLRRKTACPICKSSIA